MQLTMLRSLKFVALVAATAMLLAAAHAQTKKPDADADIMRKAPPRAEGEGPFPHLILRGATLIDGTGAPPVGPVDIVIEKNRITKIVNVGFPGVPLTDKIPASKSFRPKAGPGDKELDVTGMYVLPGFINAHVHIGPVHSTGAEYIFKLWLGHGITTVREVWGENGIAWTLDERRQERAQRDYRAAHQGLHRVRHACQRR